MMRRVMVALLILLACASVSWAQDGTVSSQKLPMVVSAPKPDAATLTEVQKLKAEVFTAKVQIAQLKATLADRDSKLASVDLTAEQAKLATEFLAQVKAPPGATWNWGTMSAQVPEKAPKPPDPTSPKK